MAENTILDLEAMANETLDAIPDAPDYGNPPAGEYILDVKDAVIEKYRDKQEIQRQRLRITYSVAETVNTVNNEPPVANGTLFTETFMATEQGLSFFKKRIKELMNLSDTQGVTLTEMMSSVKGAQVRARLSIKKTPKKVDGVVVPGEFYENLMIKVVNA